MRKTGSDPCQAIQLVYIDENGKLKTDPEAIGALQNLKGPVAVVSLFGKSLNGKSFIWNQLISRSIGFEVQTLHRPCSGDIWMWIEPVKRISEDGTEYNLVLLDVEGADSNGIPIFALAILLSSVFIYGQTLGVNDIAFDLSRLLEISEHDNVGEAKDNKFLGLGKFSPTFVQLMTDNNSEAMEGVEDVTQNDKTDNLQPQLLYGVNSLVKFVSERVRPKKRGDTIITGPPLAGFTKSFSENVNNNVVPKISSLWLSVEELEGNRARDTATEVYMSSLEHLETNEESMLMEAHNKAVFKALVAFCDSSIGNAEVKQKYENELWCFFAKAFEDRKRVANMEAYSRCFNAIEDMSKKLSAMPCSHQANIGDMIMALDTAVAEYELSNNSPMKWQTLSSFLKKSIQDILVHQRGNQMDELLSENSKLKLQHRSMENTIDMLKKQLEGGEKMRKEYQKRYESAIDDMNKLSDQFRNRIQDLESKCKSIHNEHSNLMDVLGSTRLEASEWKRKYEETLNETGVRSNSDVGVDASIDWRIKYENTVSEQKAILEKIMAMEEKLKQASVTEDGIKAEFSRVLDEKEKIVTEKDAKLATLEQQLASTRSELKKSELKMNECSLETKGLKLQISALNEKYESVTSTAKLRETEMQRLKQEKDELEKQYLSQSEELKNLCLNLKNKENEASLAKKLVDSLRMEAEAAENNEKKLQASLLEKSIELDKAKNRIKELEDVCSKLDGGESEASPSKKREAEALRMSVNELKSSLQEKCVEIDQCKSRIEELEKLCFKLKSAETEAVTAKELVSSMTMEIETARNNENKLQTLLREKGIEIEDLEKQKTELSEMLEMRVKQNEEAVAETQAVKAKEVLSSMTMEMETARNNENKLQTLLREKSIEIDRAKGLIEDLERQKTELSKMLEMRVKQNEEAVAEWQKLINVEKEKTTQAISMQRRDSLMVSEEARPIQSVKRLKVEASMTYSSSDYAEEMEEDTVSQESRRTMIAMTPRKCTSTGIEAGGSSSGIDHSKYTMKKLRDEILKHGFGAELVGLKNPRKKVLLELYERCVLKK